MVEFGDAAAKFRGYRFRYFLECNRAKLAAGGTAETTAHYGRGQEIQRAGKRGDGPGDEFEHEARNREDARSFPCLLYDYAKSIRPAGAIAAGNPEAGGVFVVFFLNNRIYRYNRV